MPIYVLTALFSLALTATAGILYFGNYYSKPTTPTERATAESRRNAAIEAARAETEAMRTNPSTATGTLEAI